MTAPFSLPLPEGTNPSVTATNWASDAGELFAAGFSIGFDTVGTPTPAQPYVHDYVPSLAIDATTFTSPDDLPKDATEYPEDLGYPAYQAVLAFEDRGLDVLLVYDVSGFGFQLQPVELSGRIDSGREAGRGGRRLPDDHHLRDAAEDEAAWGDPIAPWPTRPARLRRRFPTPPRPASDPVDLGLGVVS